MSNASDGVSSFEKEQQCYEISAKDLPLSCPLPNTPLWDAHPRVYLSIEKTGAAVCPYCNAAYRLLAANH